MLVDLRTNLDTIDSILNDEVGSATNADRPLNTERIGGASMSDPILSQGFRIPQSGKFSSAYPVRWRHRAATTRVHATLDGKHTLCHKPILGYNRVKDQDTLITCKKCQSILSSSQRHTEGLFQCVRCHEEKPHSEFYAVRDWRHSTMCKVCFRKNTAASQARRAKWLGGAK